MRLTVEDLSDDQREMYSGIRTWLDRGTRTKQTLTCAGFAGTGKSTVVSVLAHELPSPLAFCAFTGKAASVLGRKLAAAGIETANRIVRRSRREDDFGFERGSFESRPYCGTIHGLIYAPCDVCMVEEQYEHTFAAGCAKYEGGLDVVGAEGRCLACDPPPPVKRSGPCVQCGGARYLQRVRLDRKYRLIVVDEASMVADSMLRDLLSYDVPILAVGDHGQLPPVRGTSSLMRRPDLRLEKIHRQAADNPIIALSAKIRETGDIDYSLADGECFSVESVEGLEQWARDRFYGSRLDEDPLSPEGILGTVLVTWTNRARCVLNEGVRTALGRKGAPGKGEVVVCLKNKPPAYNGLRAVLETDGVEAEEDDEPRIEASLWFPEDDFRVADVSMSARQFFAEKTIDFDRAREMGTHLYSLGDLYDFGYALTCHKMQGSQAFEVGVLVESGMQSVLSADDRKRWLYTACTRAEKKLCVIR
ncbi:MAG: ATP-dependent DNA helicase [Acidiferrobacteraceae bacterium]